MPLVARWGSSFLRTITFLIIHRFLSLKVLLLIYLLFKKHCIQYISIWTIVLYFVKGTWHHNFMAGCGSLLWANTCSLWSGSKSWPGAGCLQRLADVDGSSQLRLCHVYYRRHVFDSFLILCVYVCYQYITRLFIVLYVNIIFAFWDAYLACEEHNRCKPIHRCLFDFKHFRLRLMDVKCYTNSRTIYEKAINHMGVLLIIVKWLQKACHKYSLHLFHFR